MTLPNSAVSIENPRSGQKTEEAISSGSKMFTRKAIPGRLPVINVSPFRYFGILRAFLLLVGLWLVATALHSVASTPPPPNSDGFLEGLGYLNALISGVFGLLVIQIGYALPAGIGRFRFGPLANRSAATRGGVTVVVYVLVALLMVYGIPPVVPGVTESATYVTGFFLVSIASGIGVLIVILLVFVGLMFRISSLHSNH